MRDKSKARAIVYGAFYSMHGVVGVYDSIELEFIIRVVSNMDNNSLVTSAIYSANDDLNATIPTNEVKEDEIVGYMITLLDCLFATDGSVGMVGTGSGANLIRMVDSSKVTSLNKTKAGFITSVIYSDTTMRDIDILLDYSDLTKRIVQL